MLRIEVTECNGRAVSIAADFDELGGTIGRREDSTLVLPDAKKEISRTHASIRFYAGSFLLQHQGRGLPTLVNRHPIAEGDEIRLQNGDEIRIGAYMMRVTVAGQHHTERVGAAIDPFADVEAGAPSPLYDRALPSRRPAAEFEDLFEQPLAPPMEGKRRGAGISDEFDPFSLPRPSHSSDLSGPLGAQGSGGLDAEPDPKIDDIYDLRIPDSWDPLGSDEPHGSEASGSGSGLGPLLGSHDSAATPRHAFTQRDDSPMLSGEFRPPRVRAETISRASADESRVQHEPRRPGQEPEAPRQSVVSWGTETCPALDKSEQIKAVILPRPKRGGSEDRLRLGESSGDIAESRSVEEQAQARRDSGASGGPSGISADGNSGYREAGAVGLQEYLDAFVRGCGITDARIGPVTPETMEVCGRLVRESVRGTLDLLRIRSETKREMRAQVTVIAAKENNPLKFLPNVDAALLTLLAPQTPGFMLPVDAMRDAYNDLRSHEFGLMAGMRAALGGVLLRFDPAELEKRLSRGGVLAALLPHARRARLWELYQKLYREIHKEAEDDFHALFGKAFLRAYEAQIERLKRDGRVDKP